MPYNPVTDELPALDPTKEYNIIYRIKSTGLTMLMRLIVCDIDEEFRVPDLTMIRKRISDYPGEVNQPCSSGYTPLMIAAANGLSEVVDILLMHGARADDKCGNFETSALSIACDTFTWHCNLGIIMKLAKHTSPSRIGSFVTTLQCTPLMFLCRKSASDNIRKSAIEAAKILLHNYSKNQLSINGKNIEDKSVLSLAIANNNDGMVDLLLEHGADPNLTEKDGNTMLMLAVNVAKNHNIINALICYGANVHAANNAQKTALDLAIEMCKDSQTNIDLLHPILTKIHYAASYEVHTDAERSAFPIKTITTACVALHALRHLFMYHLNAIEYNSSMTIMLDIMIKVTTAQNIQTIISAIPTYQIQYFMDAWKRKIIENERQITSLNETIKGLPVIHPEEPAKSESHSANSPEISENTVDNTTGESLSEVDIQQNSTGFQKL